MGAGPGLSGVSGLVRAGICTILDANFGELPFQRLSGKCSSGMIVAYPLRHGEQEIPHGSVRRRMALHPPASSRTHGTRTPQASRPEGYPRRRLLRAKERLPLAVAAKGLSTVEDGLRLVQEVAHRRHLGATERRAA